MSHSVADLIRRATVLICVGPGGVGKTTVSAALAVAAARRGRRTLVTTVDPAKRLVTALGLSALGASPQEVDVSHDRTFPKGLLHAAMLDQRHAFDRVISRHAPDSAAYQRVITNKLYRELSTRLDGGQEYAAVEMLYEMLDSPDYDLIVIDTPPSANAIDFLQAPNKMVDLLNGSAVKLFVRSYEEAGRFNLGRLGLGAGYVFKRLARFVGGDLLDDIAAFFAAMHSLLPGFRTRADAVRARLLADDVSVLMVSSAREASISETLTLAPRLADLGLAPAACVLNRVHAKPKAAEVLSLQAIEEELSTLGTPVAEYKPLARKIANAGLRAHLLAQADAAQLDKLRRVLPDTLSYHELPLLDRDVHDLMALDILAAQLCRPLSEHSSL